MTKTGRRNYSQRVAAVILPSQQTRSFLKPNVDQTTTSLMPLLLHLTRTKKSNLRAKDASSRPLLQLANLVPQPRKHLNTTLMQTSKLIFRPTSLYVEALAPFAVPQEREDRRASSASPVHSLDTSRKSRFVTYKMTLVNLKLSRAGRRDIEPLHNIR